MKQITQQLLATLEHKATLIDSEHFSGLTYAVEPGKYLSIMSTYKGNVIDIDARNVEQFVSELWEIYSEWVKGK